MDEQRRGKQNITIPPPKAGRNQRGVPELVSSPRTVHIEVDELASLKEEPSAPLPALGVSGGSVFGVHVVGIRPGGELEL